MARNLLERQGQDGSPARMGAASPGPHSLRAGGGLVLKSALVGLLVGGLVSLYRRLFFLAEGACLSAYASLRAQPEYLPLGLAVLAVLGLCTGLLLRRYAMIGGSGIPQVKGIIMGRFKQRWLSTLLAKFVGGLAAIGAGLSLGREGPSIQLGACVADGLSDALARSETERGILIAGGASAGLAA
ncbi:MAG: chloride channel protein, partial [Deltaproteobacteria bacterium]|nr:chloride channel protein [Deltaproteobacteria bacterium]